MKKRISIFVLALLLLPCIFMLSACGGNDNKSNNSSQSQKYSITFIVDEEIYAKIETSGNEYIQLPTSPTKNGYTFDGWFLDKTTYQNELKANTYANTKPNSNINVFAKFTYMINSNNFGYSVSKGKATITSFNNSENLTTVEIPSYINSFPVETIGASAFINQTMLRNVIICNGIKTIEAGAFYGCNSMESISLPNTLETIECNAFENCEILEKITLPNSLQKIGANAFKNCTELKSVEFNSDGWWLANNTEYVFEKNVDTSNCAENAQNLLTNEISKTWFNYELYTINYHLNDGQLPENAPLYFSEYIELKLVNATKKGYTFGGYYLDSNFTSQKVEKIEKGTTSFEVYTKWNIITYKIEYNLNGGTTSGNNLTTYNIEMNSFQLLTTTKDYYDFVGWYDDSDNLFGTINTQQCENISLTAKFTPTVYTISYALNGGTNDSSNPTTYTVETQTITLQPATFENEKVSRWYNKQSFETRITTIPKGSHGNIKLYARAGYDDSELFVIENNVLTRMEKTLIDEFNITKIVIPNDITEISSGALSGLSSLEEITIPFVGGSPTENTYFGYIFGASSCLDNSSYVPSSIKKVDITDGTSIRNYAFHYCDDLTSITIPDSVTSIGEGAFSLCSGLISLKVEEGNEIYHSDGNCIIETNSKTLIVGCKTSIIPNDGSVTNIGDYAFCGCSGLTSMTIPDSVTSIGGYALSSCISLTSISIPDYKNVDPNHRDYEINAKDSRISKYNSTGKYHKIWLDEIPKMSDEKLNTNSIGLKGNQIKQMAKEILEKLGNQK